MIVDRACEAICISNNLTSTSIVSSHLMLGLIYDDAPIHDDFVLPMDITMSRVRLASDTFDVHFTYTKVNHLLYACSLDPFEDGIILDTPLLCMHRYCRNAMDDEEECERECTTTPSARKRANEDARRRATEEAPANERPDDTGRPAPPSERTSGPHQTTGTSTPEPIQR